MGRLSAVVTIAEIGYGASYLFVRSWLSLLNFAINIAFGVVQVDALKLVQRNFVTNGNNKNIAVLCLVYARRS